MAIKAVQAGIKFVGKATQISARTSRYLFRIDAALCAVFIGGMFIGGPIFGAEASEQSCYESRKFFLELREQYIETFERYTAILDNSNFNELEKYSKELDEKFLDYSKRAVEIKNKFERDIMIVQLISISLISAIIILFVIKYFFYSKKLI